MPVGFERVEINGIPGWHVTSGELSVTVLPPIGGKLISIKDRSSGHEYLSQPGDISEYRQPTYGADFGEYDISGWDECFPAIGRSIHPVFPWNGVEIPDHGELWTLPWSGGPQDDGLLLTTEGVRFPYTFSRRMDFDDDGFSLTYTVTNRSSYALACYWSAHPLFTATPSTRVLIPAEAMRVEISFSGRLGPRLTRHPWPITTDQAGREVELDLMGPIGAGEADKLYSSEVEEGWAALVDEESGRWLAFTFDKNVIPFVGYWANRSGWPEDRPSYNIALEPCSGYPDSLDIAYREGAYIFIPANGSTSWRLRVTIGGDAHDLENLIGAGTSTPTS